MESESGISSGSTFGQAIALLGLRISLQRLCIGRKLPTDISLPDLKLFYSAFPHFPLVSISHDQRRPMPPVNWAGGVHHGVPKDLLPFVARSKGDYLAFLGRISREKRPDRAIEIAARAGMKLKVAAKIDRADRDYWDAVIKPLVDLHPNVEYVGEINERQKAEFLGQARALLFPIDWPEPFGLVMIEAMACGTPVIAFRNGSTPEVIDDGVTGFIVNDLREAVAAVRTVEKLDRAEVRTAFEERFTAERMALDYLAIYRDLSGVRRAEMRASLVISDTGNMVDLQGGA